eukprot:9273237-Pyramimonas_sp.AAC.1
MLQHERDVAEAAYAWEGALPGARLGHAAHVERVHAVDLGDGFRRLLLRAAGADTRGQQSSSRA